MSPATALPPVLLVEDDPTSTAFLADASAALPLTLHCAASSAQALHLASRMPFALWLIDDGLPDGDGSSLLAALRRQTPLPHPPALAHTASRDPAKHRALLAAGFASVIVKPVAAGLWQQRLRQALNLPAPAQWDDAAALRVLHGNTASVSALRQLFLADLPGQLAAVEAALARHDRTALHGILHQLKASCGFVGATALLAHVEALDAAPADAACQSAFFAAARALQARG